MSYQKLVAEFHRTCDIPVGTTPGMRRAPLRASLIREEARETVDALRLGDLVGFVDGLCDLVYVALGAGVEFGVRILEVCPAPPSIGRPHIPDPAYWIAEISESAAIAVDLIEREDLGRASAALADLVTCCYLAAAAAGVNFDPFFREVHRANMAKAGGPRREDGKLLKPPGWQPPRIAEILESQRS